VCSVRSPEGARRNTRGLDGPLEPNVSTRFESSPTSDVFSSRTGRCSSFFLRLPTAFACLFRRPEGPRRSTCSSHALSGIPNRLERSSLSLPRRFVRLPNALTPVIVSIPRSAIPRARAPVRPFPEGIGATACRKFRSCELNPCSRTTRFHLATRVSTLVSTRSLRAHHPQPHPFSFHVTCPEGSGELDHLSPHSGPRAPLARLTSRTSTPQGCGGGGDPGRNRPMSATHDSVFKRWEPIVSVHSASRIPTRHDGSRSTPLSSQPR